MKAPIQEIFKKEVLVQFDTRNKLNLVKLGEKTEKENSLGVQYRTIEERTDELAVESSYAAIGESLTLLDSISKFTDKCYECLHRLDILGKKKGKFLVTKDKMSVVDLVLAEQLTMISIFNSESLEAFPNVRKWFQYLIFLP